MAFMGMVFGALIIGILLTIFAIVGVCLLLGIILKIVGRAKNSKGARIAGTVFFVIALVLIAPVIALFTWGYFKTAFIEVNMPDGNTVKLHHSVTTEFRDTILAYIDNGNEEDYEAVESMIDENEALVYYRDGNFRGILEFGIDAGNADIVRLALESGAPVDCPDRYDVMSSYHSTWLEYLDETALRTVTEDDIEIAQMLFDADCDTELPQDRVPYYSNLFGRAVWVILYNDETVSDTEMEFLQVFIDHGFDSDSSFMPVYDVPSNYLFGPETHEDVERNDNYYEVLDMTAG